MNILITSAGRRVSLVKTFQHELRELLPGGLVFCADVNPKLSAACQIADGFFQVPYVTDLTYIEALIDICLSHDINMIIPTIDTELIPLSASKKTFLNHNIYCIISDYNIILQCRNKRETHKLFDKLGLNHAHEQDLNNLQFPLFVKPANGSCSKDIFIFRNKSEINNEILINPDFLILNYMDPKLHIEFTVDLYFNRHSQLCCVVPRERIEIRGGEVSKGITRKNILVDILLEKFVPINGFKGCINMQFFLHKHTNVVNAIEINPRFGGGYPLSYHAGANFPKWIIEEYFFGRDIDIYNAWEENLLMLRYDNEILIHGA